MPRRAQYDVRDPNSVVRAIQEYRRLGQTTFMGNYGGIPPRKYWLLYEGRLYEAKAILDKAHRLEHSEEKLPCGDFEPSKKNVRDRLERLGFQVKAIEPSPTPPQVGREAGE